MAGTTTIVTTDLNIYRRAAKVLVFEVDVPKDYFADLKFVLINKNFAFDQIVDFCNMQVVKVGSNFPCVHMVHDVTFQNNISNSKTIGEWVVFNQDWQQISYVKSFSVRKYLNLLKWWSKTCVMSQNPSKLRIPRYL